jgi:predicted RNase H-like HicB family nuclease
MNTTTPMATSVGVLEGKGRVWGVRIPDAPGFYGAGPTPEAAIEDATSALAELVGDGHEIASPRYARADQGPAAEAKERAGDVVVRHDSADHKEAIGSEKANGLILLSTRSA